MADDARRGEAEHADEERARLHAREIGADERDRTADGRDEVADRRDELADDRQRRADLRDLRADQRDKSLDIQGGWLDQRHPAGGVADLAIIQRALTTIARSRDLIRDSQARLDRAEGAVSRAKARAQREQEAVEREVSATARQVGDSDIPGGLAADVERLRKLALMLVTELGAAQDASAEQHERLAHGNSRHKDFHRAHAEQARTEARRTREAARLLSPEPSTSEDEGRGGGAAPSD
ncbi:coiled-coil domain-containing protein [Streptomyces endophyticus]|uniref:Uncharacterized protein n=1 Tax=Streptomyces endophyticus TaxID=714166 RepID=A0ABU6F5S2_9ACTN|nr:hypothetical protein [Streptomyces endophyticus]MEB8339365.1 hypothetical protein [Streptomyces endophyticus]